MARRDSTRNTFISASFALFSFLIILVSAVAINAQEFVPTSEESTANPTPKSEQMPRKTPLPDVASDPTAGKSKNLEIEFVKDAPGVIVIKSGGKTYRVDSNAKTFTEIQNEGPTRDSRADETPAEALARDSEKTLQDDSEEEDPFFYEPGDEPFDYRLINIPTPKIVPKGSWNLSFSHRFSQPIHPISESAENLLGFDSFSVSSFGVTYGITDKLYVSASRSPVCRRGLCKTIELGAGYHFTDQSESSPLGLSVFGSVEGDMNFSQDYTVNFQLMVSRRVGKRVHLFFSPAAHLFSNGGGRFDPRPEDFFPPAPIANMFNQPKHGASFGFGAAVAVTPTLLGTFEFVPRTGFKLGRVTPVFDQSFNITGFDIRSKPTIGFGVQKNVGNHSFALTFSNTQTTTTSRYNSSNLLFSPRRLAIGFNLFRRL
ncbi:MAG: DUF5777 family beta-barrel protein [Acidobacteriota bacterium]|nr:DUF5777 family beta-barrel protein [Acidobacteriota bacterium]MDH3529438.1 DUF5777 family beta-barrel protein [Acidobacteriota bacterium]